MGIFQKSSLAFICSNIIRFITVISLCLVIAGNIVLMVKNIQAFHHQPDSSSPSSASTQTFVTTTVTTVLPTQTSSSGSGSKKNYTTSSEHFIVAVRSTSVASEAEADNQVTVANIDDRFFVSGTDVPNSPGAIFFLSLAFVLQILFSILLILTEIPPPPIVRALEHLLPPLFYSSTVSMLIPGLLYMYLASSLLSHSSLGNEFVTVAGWFLFVMGGLNVIFLGGIAWMAGIDVRDMRSIFNRKDKKSFSPRAASSKYSESDLESQSSRNNFNYGEKAPIQISRPEPSFNGAAQDENGFTMLPMYNSAK